MGQQRSENAEIGELTLGARATGLDSRDLEWLLARLRTADNAPLVPISDLARVLERLGISVTELPHPLATPEELLAEFRQRLFPAARMRSIERFLQRARDEHLAGNETEQAAFADRLATALRGRVTSGAVLRAVVTVSLEHTHGLPALSRVVQRIRNNSWPAKSPADITDYEPVVRRLPVRVRPVDLIGALQQLHGRRSKPKSRLEERAQLPLLGPDTRPLLSVEGSGWLTQATRRALVEELDAFATQHLPDPEVRRYSRALSALLQGAPVPYAALDALLRASALDLMEACSPAELARLEATLAKGPAAAAALIDYGDYLARAQRPEEAVRAYLAARHLAPPRDRHRIDERIAARENRIASGAHGRFGPKPDPDQLTFPFGETAGDAQAAPAPTGGEERRDR